MRGIRRNKKTLRIAVVLAAVLLTATILATVTTVQTQNQNTYQLINLYVQGFSHGSNNIIHEKTIYISDDYTFNGNIYEPIVVTADEIVIDGNGYTLQGPGSGYGFDLRYRTGVTIKNVTVTGWTYGFYLFESYFNILTGNTVNNNLYGFYLEYEGGAENEFWDNTATNNNYGFYLSPNSERNYFLLNNATNNDYGFYLLGVYNYFDNNVANNNTQSGFYLWSSWSNGLSGNTANNNTQSRFYLDHSSGYNRLSGNTADNNTNGFYLSDSSNNNILTSNTATNNKVHGFLLSDSLYNTLTGNTANNNTNGYGFYLQQSSNNNILTSNNANNNSVGFYLSGSENTLSGNTATNNNVHGFLLSDSLYNNLSGNTAANNTQSGFCLDPSSNNNNLTGNTATNNEVHGFYLYQSPYNTLTGNIANNHNNGNGFHLWSSSNNNLTGNIANNNGYYGFSLYSSSNNNNLTGNTATNNLYGFCLESSSNNNLTGNNAINNNNHGFYLESSSYNNLIGNTATNNGWYGFWLDNSLNNNLTGNTALNCTSGGYRWYPNSINNDFTGSVEAYYLRVKVIDVLGYPISGADVKVETDGTVVYRTPYFGGSDPQTDSGGVTPWIAVAYRTFTTNDTMTLNINTVTVYYQGFPIAGDNPRTVSVAGSNVETFQVVDNVYPTVNIIVPINDVMVNTGVIWIYGTFDGTGSQVVSITINDTARFELVLPVGVGPYGVTGSYAFRNKTVIPTGEFGVLVTVQDGAGYIDTAVRHVIVDQDNPTVVIIVPPGGGSVNVGEVWINGTFDGTGSQVVNISINDTRFTLFEPSGPPYGVTGTYSFNATIPLVDAFTVEVTVQDEAGHTAAATRFILVEDQEDPTVAITSPPSGGTVSVGVVWINGTFDGTGSPVVNISINDTRFELFEPSGPPYGVTGTYSFNATIPLGGGFTVEVTIQDEAGHTAAATRHIVVEGQPSMLPAVFSALMLSGVQGGVSPMVYAAVGVAGAAGVAAAVLFYYFRRVKA
ncbi:MAG: NosD domain-containing protein [Candidatus Lokiarchaeia archaeon]